MTLAVDTAALEKEAKAKAKLAPQGSPQQPVTQKAKGVMLLRRHLPNHGSHATMGLWGPGEVRLLPYEEPPKLPAFARPCPVRPRHGFVDSRPVASFQELLQVWGEAKAADAEAEMLVMGRLTGRFSAVAANAGVTWGEGNDGATGTGKRALVIPTPTTVKVWNKTALYHGMAIDPVYVGIKDTAYLEIVEDAWQARCVQVRDGPAQVAARDYVPHADYVVTAEHVHKLKGEPDLLQWEKDIAALKGKKGACVWAPGLPLSSHYAVHAITNGVACYTGEDNPAGQTLQPAAGTPAPLTDADFSAIAKLLSRWARTSFSPNSLAFRGKDGAKLVKNASSDGLTAFQRDIAITACGCLHAQAMWSNAPHLLNLRAFGVIALAKLFSASCIGEARHFGRIVARHGKTSNIDWQKLGGWSLSKAKSGGIERDQVYREALDYGLGKLRVLLMQSEKDFRTPGWGAYDKAADKDMNTSFSYGGPKWADAAAIGGALINAVNAFILCPSAEGWAEIVDCQNKAVNAAHNGGVILNKWLNKSEMDRMAVCPGVAFLNGIAGHVTLSV